MPLIGKASPEDMNLHHIRYKWAYDLYNQAVRNTWFPHEIALKEDLQDWEKMTEDEKHAVKFLECHLYLAKQMWEEANHCVAFEYVLETFPFFDRDKLFNLHLDIPSMQAKEKYINRFMKRMTEDTLIIDSIDGKKDFIRNLVATNIVMEGIWFYSGFMVALSFRQRNQLRNFGSMINWVLRDESLHLKFGMNLVHNILEENPELLTEDFAKEIRNIVVEGVDLETAYNKDLFPNGILGLNADYVNQYVQYVADRRLEELGLPKFYGATNPAKWMSAATDVYELVNFFEAQNTSYEVDGHSAAVTKDKDKEDK